MFRAKLRWRADRLPVRLLRGLLAGGALALLAACSSTPPSTPPAPTTPVPPDTRPITLETRQRSAIAVAALSTIGTPYRYGGRHPSTGLDCSGLVRYAVAEAGGPDLPHHAASIAARTRNVDRDELRPGDLVFFNTTGRAHSHMGIYIGDNRFVHAPSSRGNGAVRIDRLDQRYWARRLDGLRSLSR